MPGSMASDWVRPLQIVTVAVTERAEDVLPAATAGFGVIIDPYHKSLARPRPIRQVLS